MSCVYLKKNRFYVLTLCLYYCILFIFLIEIISFFKVDKYSVDGEIFVGSQNPEAGPGPDVIKQIPAVFSEQIFWIRRVSVIKHEKRKQFRRPKFWLPNEEIFVRPML